MHPNIQHCLFAVVDDPYCVWGWDLPERNLNFIKQIDPEFFEYVCRTHREHIGGENAQLAAMALRSNYHLALETLFGLMAASLQAPDCLAGWILKATTSDVRLITKELAADRMKFPVKWRPIIEHVGFGEVAKLVFQNSVWSSEEDFVTIKNFAAIWYRLAFDFLDDHSIKEYNSIKHGFRARAGGFFMRVGLETEPGAPCAPEKMQDMGGSHFGTSFYSAEPIGETKGKRRDPNFMLRSSSLNWLPDNTANRMLLAALSIKNLKSFLEITAGANPQTVEFYRPDNAADFLTPWETAPSITSVGMDFTVSESDIKRTTKSELKEILCRSRNQ